MKILKQNSPLVSERQLAKLLQLNEDTLRKMRRRKNGPPYLRIGKSVRYDLSMVNDYLSKNLYKKAN